MVSQKMVVDPVIPPSPTLAAASALDIYLEPRPPYPFASFDEVMSDSGATESLAMTYNSSEDTPAPSVSSASSETPIALDAANDRDVNTSSPDSNINTELPDPTVDSDELGEAEQDIDEEPKTPEEYKHQHAKLESLICEHQKMLRRPKTMITDKSAANNILELEYL
jgi:hypothetical protein